MKKNIQLLIVSEMLCFIAWIWGIIGKNVLILGGLILFFTVVDSFFKFKNATEKKEKRLFGVILIISIICCITPFILGSDMLNQYCLYEKKENELKLYNYMEDLHDGIIYYIVDNEREDNDNQKEFENELCEGEYLSELQNKNEWKDVLKYSKLNEENEYNRFLECMKHCEATDLFFKCELQDSDIKGVKIIAVGTSLEVY